MSLVDDGDTFILDDGNTKHDIRLEGIDAPETRGDQAFGAEATAALDAKVAGKKVKVVWLSKDDRWRLLGHVYVGNRWINLEMVEDGWAWHFKKYSTDKHLAEAEKAARASRRGIWEDEDPISPEEFRRGKRRK